MPKVRYNSLSQGEVVPTAAEQKREMALTEIRDTANRGKGVFARRRIPAKTRILVYPGFLHPETRLKNGSYAWETYAVGYTIDTNAWENGGLPYDDYTTPVVIDVLEKSGKVSSKFSEYAAPRVNEPSLRKGETNNITIVHNLTRFVNRKPAPALEYWSNRDIEPGEELLVCYGSSYQNLRTYAPKGCEDAPMYIYGDTSELRSVGPADYDKTILPTKFVTSILPKKQPRRTSQKRRFDIPIGTPSPPKRTRITRSTNTRLTTNTKSLHSNTNASTNSKTLYSSNRAKATYNTHATGNSRTLNSNNRAKATYNTHATGNAKTLYSSNRAKATYNTHATGNSKTLYSNNRAKATYNTHATGNAKTLYSNNRAKATYNTHATGNARTLPGANQLRKAVNINSRSQRAASISVVPRPPTPNVTIHGRVLEPGGIVTVKKRDFVSHMKHPKFSETFKPPPHKAIWLGLIRAVYPGKGIVVFHGRVNGRIRSHFYDMKLARTFTTVSTSPSRARDVLEVLLNMAEYYEKGTPPLKHINPSIMQILYDPQLVQLLDYYQRNFGITLDDMFTAWSEINPLLRPGRTVYVPSAYFVPKMQAPKIPHGTNPPHPHGWPGIILYSYPDDGIVVDHGNLFGRARIHFYSVRDAARFRTTPTLEPFYSTVQHLVASTVNMLEGTPPEAIMGVSPSELEHFWHTRGLPPPRIDPARYNL
jgi:hypothetical protein